MADTLIESPPLLSATELLPEEVRIGPSHTVAETVRNDGALNIYTITSPVGAFEAHSTAQLIERIKEIYAIMAVDEITAPEAFGDAVVQQGSQVVDTVTDTVTDPAGVVESTVSGIGTTFGHMRERLRSLFSKRRAGNHEDGVLARVFGVTEAKRQYAKQLNVDPYSTNVVLQQRLDGVSRAGALGNVLTKAAKFAIPGNMGIVVKAVSGASSLHHLDVSLSPTEMRVRNRERLVAAGISQEAATLFLNNGRFTPVQQGLLTNSLAQLQGVADLEAMLRFADTAANEDVAIFQRQMAAMLARYHTTVRPLKQLYHAAGYLAAISETDQWVIVAPVDYLVWTPFHAQLVDMFAVAPITEGLPAVWGREFRVEGMVSPTAKRALEAGGWAVVEERRYFQKAPWWERVRQEAAFTPAQN